MAAGEDQPKLVVLAVFFLPFLGTTPRTLPQAVNGLETADRHEPRPRIGRHPVPPPLRQGRRESVVECVLGEIEVSKQANKGG